MTYSLIDTHCHLDIIQEQGQDIALSLEKAKVSGVEKIVQIGIDLPSSIRAKTISKDFNSEGLAIHYTIGCHPTESPEFSNLEKILEFAKDQLSDPMFTGMGEIGIDLFHDASNRSEQRDILSKFLDFSSRNSLPVVIHSRDAFEETYEGLKEYKGKAFGVIHCFTYDYEMGKKFIELGYYISFSGIVAFKNAKEIHEAAKKLPLESMLIETDAPYLSPPPYRGKRNDSSNMPYILESIVSLRPEDRNHVAEQLYLNSEKFINRRPLHA